MKLNEYTQAIQRKYLKEDFWNPGVEFNNMCDIYNEVEEAWEDTTGTDWNHWDQATRDAMCDDVARIYIDKYGEPSEELFDDMVDSNYHSQARAFERAINSMNESIGKPKRKSINEDRHSKKLNESSNGFRQKVVSVGVDIVVPEHISSEAVVDYVSGLITRDAVFEVVASDVITSTDEESYFGESMKSPRKKTRHIKLKEDIVHTESLDGIDMDEFVDRFNDNYEYLYTGGDRREDYRDLVEKGDNLIERLSVDEPVFMKELSSHRADVLSSDREVVAFLLTWNEFNGIDGHLTEDYDTAIFNTKFSKNIHRNGQRVSIIGTNNDSRHDTRYTIKFEDGTVLKNVFPEELRMDESYRMNEDSDSKSDSDSKKKSNSDRPKKSPIEYFKTYVKRTRGVSFHGEEVWFLSKAVANNMVSSFLKKFNFDDGTLVVNAKTAGGETVYAVSQRPLKESLFGDYSDYDGWAEEDIELHKNIDWASRNYFDYPVDGDSFESTAVLYTPQGKKTTKTTFVKYIRSNPIFPPYYAPKDMKPFGTKIGYVGPMADGHVKNGYDIHDRYETQEVYDILSR